MLYIIIPAAIVVIITIWLISSYNRLASESLKVTNQWSQIDIVLKQRADVIPGLIETVSGYAGYEKGIIEKLSEARKSYVSAGSPQQVMDGAAAMSGALGRFMAVAEAYPELKANQNFLDFQRQLSDIERKLADFRQFYNDTVMRYNKIIVTFPSNIAAGMFGYKDKPFFQVSDEDKAAPKIKFNA